MVVFSVGKLHSELAVITYNIRMTCASAQLARQAFLLRVAFAFPRPRVSAGTRGSLAGRPHARKLDGFIPGSLGIGVTYGGPPWGPGAPMPYSSVGHGGVLRPAGGPQTHS
jgi:hypothetical protein